MRREVSRLNALLYANELTFQRVERARGEAVERGDGLAAALAEAEAEAASARDEAMYAAEQARGGVTELRGRHVSMLTIERDQLRMHVQARDATIDNLKAALEMARGERLDQILALEREIDRLNQSLASAAVVHKARGDKLDRLAGQAATLRREYDDALHAHAHEMAMERSKAEDLEQRLESALGRARTAEHKVAALASARDAAQANEKTLQASVGHLQTELVSANETINSLAGQLAAAHSADAIPDLVASFEAQISRMRSRYESRIHALHLEIDQANRVDHHREGVAAEEGEEGVAAEEGDVGFGEAYLFPSHAPQIMSEEDSLEFTFSASPATPLSTTMDATTDATTAATTDATTDAAMAATTAATTAAASTVTTATQTPATPTPTPTPTPTTADAATNTTADAVAADAVAAEADAMAAVAEMEALTHTNARLTLELQTTKTQLHSARQNVHQTVQELERALDAANTRTTAVHQSLIDTQRKYDDLSVHHNLLIEKHNAALDAHRDALVQLKETAPHIAFDALRQEILALHASYVHEKRLAQKTASAYKRRLRASAHPDDDHVVPSLAFSDISPDVDPTPPRPTLDAADIAGIADIADAAHTADAADAADPSSFFILPSPIRPTTFTS